MSKFYAPGASYPRLPFQQFSSTLIVTLTFLLTEPRTYLPYAVPFRHRWGAD